MGSMIQLAVGQLEIDWGKNHSYHDYSALFQATDVCSVPYHYISYELENFSAVGDSGEPIVEYKEGLSKPLNHVVDRINLLGYTYSYVEREFALTLSACDVDEVKFSFQELANALKVVDVKAISIYDASDDNLGKFFRRYLFDALSLSKHASDPEYVKYNAGEALENLSAYCILQLLACNPAALNLPVTWQYADLEENGWGHREHFVKPLDQADRFLIVTEGSSDAGIIQHALRILKPHVADFFDFVDMNEGYPFSGTGNLFNFTKGLIGISVQNNVVIIYDNDAEGVYNFNRSIKLNTPPNMKVLKLPDLDAFDAFQTIGPSGQHIADINGKAAAIECYLDVGPSAAVRWTGFNKELEVYHGELVNKREAMKAFYALSDQVEGYDFSRISAVIEMIMKVCVEMRVSARLGELELDFRRTSPDEEKNKLDASL